MQTTPDCANAGDLNVLNHLMDVLDYKTPTKLSPRHIARHLEMQVSDVQGAISRILDQGVLQCKINEAGTPTYYLNPRFDAKRRTLAARMEAARIRFVA